MWFIYNLLLQQVNSCRGGPIRYTIQLTFILHALVSCQTHLAIVFLILSFCCILFYSHNIGTCVYYRGIPKRDYVHPPRLYTKRLVLPVTINLCVDCVLWYIIICISTLIIGRAYYNCAFAELARFDYGLIHQTKPL